MTKLNFHLIRSLIAIFPIFFLKILHPDSLDFQRKYLSFHALRIYLQTPEI